MNRADYAARLVRKCREWATTTLPERVIGRCETVAENRIPDRVKAYLHAQKQTPEELEGILSFAQFQSKGKYLLVGDQKGVCSVFDASSIKIYPQRKPVEISAGNEISGTKTHETHEIHEINEKSCLNILENDVNIRLVRRHNTKIESPVTLMHIVKCRSWSSDDLPSGPSGPSGPPVPPVLIVQLYAVPNKVVVIGPSSVGCLCVEASSFITHLDSTDEFIFVGGGRHVAVFNRNYEYLRTFSDTAVDQYFRPIFDVNCLCIVRAKKGEIVTCSSLGTGLTATATPTPTPPGSHDETATIHAGSEVLAVAFVHEHLNRLFVVTASALMLYRVHGRATTLLFEYAVPPPKWTWKTFPAVQSVTCKYLCSTASQGFSDLALVTAAGNAVATYIFPNLPVVDQDCPHSSWQTSVWSQLVGGDEVESCDATLVDRCLHLIWSRIAKPPRKPHVGQLNYRRPPPFPQENLQMSPLVWQRNPEDAGVSAHCCLALASVSGTVELRCLSLGTAPPVPRRQCSVSRIDSVDSATMLWCAQLPAAVNSEIESEAARSADGPPQTFEDRQWMELQLGSAPGRQQASLIKGLNWPRLWDVRKPERALEQPAWKVLWKGRILGSGNKGTDSKSDNSKSNSRSDSAPKAWVPETIPIEFLIQFSPFFCAPDFTELIICNETMRRVSIPHQASARKVGRELNALWRSIQVE